MSAACAETVNAFYLVVIFKAAKPPFLFPNSSAFTTNNNCTKENTLYNFIDWICFYDEMKGINVTAVSTGKYFCKI